MGMSFSGEPKVENINKSEMDAWSDRLKQVAKEVWGDEADSQDLANKPRVEISADSARLEVTLGDVYVRIVTGESENRNKPFHFRRYVSDKYPTSPKTEFYEGNNQSFTPMDASEVEIEVEKEIDRIRSSR